MDNIGSFYYFRSETPEIRFLFYDFIGLYSLNHAWSFPAYSSHINFFVLMHLPNEQIHNHFVEKYNEHKMLYSFQ